MAGSKHRTIHLIIVVGFIGYIFLFYFAYIKYGKTIYIDDDSVFKRSGNKKVIIAFRNDDISAYSDPLKEEKILNIFWKYKIKQTFAIIPNFDQSINVKQKSKNPKISIVEKLQEWHGRGKIEYALHGYRHKRRNNSHGEFYGEQYEDQFQYILEGKKILKDYLKAEVKIFAPPLNQADSNTIKACENAGINIFSGYLGEKSSKTLLQVNTNAVLFSKNSNLNIKENLAIPHFSQILKHAKSSEKLIFIIVFYHSNTDFNSSTDFIELDNILKNISNDKNIEIISIEQAAHLYKDFLLAYNQAGFNIKNANFARHVSKPYIYLADSFLKIINVLSDHEKLLENTYNLFWSGYYKEANENAINVIKKFNYYLLLGRVSIFLAFNVFLALCYFYFKTNKPKQYIKYMFAILLAVFSMLVISIIYVNIYTDFSEIRMQEFNIFIFFIINSLFIVYLFLKNPRSKKNNLQIINK